MNQDKPYGVVCDTTRDEIPEIFPGTLAGLCRALYRAKLLSGPGAVWSVRKDKTVIRRYQGGMEVQDASTATACSRG